MAKLTPDQVEYFGPILYSIQTRINMINSRLDGPIEEWNTLQFVIMASAARQLADDLLLINNNLIFLRDIENGEING
jgi:hypothetical protein